MLTVIPPKNPSVAVTSNSDISSWNTSADIVLDASTGKTYYADKVKETYQQLVAKNPYPIESPIYMLDETGCITTDASKAKSILYQEIKDGHVITRQEPVSDTDREIAKLWNIVEEIDKSFQERELMWQKINKELDRADQLLEESKKTSYWACGGSGSGGYYT